MKPTNLKIPTAIVMALWTGSVAAAPVCRMYEHANYGGQRITLHSDEAVNFYSGQFWNDRVSSVRVGHDCELVVFEHTEMDGRSREFHNDRRYVGDWWNDRISSAECYCDD